MSRNTEKAQSMLYRFQEQQASELGLVGAGISRRPRNISSVESVPLCEKWRSQVIRDISRKVTKIQDNALSDYQVRDLNDEINKLIKEKYVWELHLKHLGGPNYLLSRSTYDSLGQELPFARGYKYFGRAKQLPDVKQLFEIQTEKRKQQAIDAQSGVQRRTLRSFSADYYGFSDDSHLVKQENQISKFNKEMNDSTSDNSSSDNSSSFPSFVDIPSIDQIESLLVNRRKRQLSDMYL